MDDEEIWAEIPGFPGYLVSNHGRFWSIHFDRELKLHVNQYGDRSVGLRLDGMLNRYMAKRIVASVFVEGFDEDAANTPMLLDGDQANLHWANIVWRPRWFATTYVRQIRNPLAIYFNGPVIDQSANEYETVLDAAMAVGALPKTLFMSIYNETRCPPGGERFYWK